ncbi:Metalloenzyme, LuxS/M16 peptidase-like protein [Jimgerdemannia flammicorona]|uniref:Presequence protease, mitochondrial n=1 Tax=Jimgerdemannia flammicorona TaxID=994334 RepID=A0A433CTC6_9FUNG|nr:Metalloenzyme, LuxS/M16 peptidase-like protein [Jimgerdemannia flammicorona]
MLSSLAKASTRLVHILTSPSQKPSLFARRFPRVLSFRRYSEMVTSKASFKPGDRLQGYQVQQVREVPELQLTAVVLKHEATGAEHLHIARDDTNNVFAVGFATPVSDNTGVPHILEHTTLCGSKQFPVRDPFFKMLNRSLATFMNAFTASDYTIYPFATTNPVDFKNLRNVYMDAVFFPHLRELDFKQEGWRLEHEDPKDKSTPIVFKGVVYNEMKGALSDAGSLFYSRMHQQMFPGTTYEYISGGDPQYITDLTHQQLVEFHRSHYHPSNAKFYTYGSFPLEEHLAAVDDRIKGFSHIEPPTVNKVVTPWTEPKRVKLTCPPDPRESRFVGAFTINIASFHDHFTTHLHYGQALITTGFKTTVSNPEKQTKMSVSFLTNDSTDSFETFSMRLLSYLLLDGHASPMYKALIDTNIGSEFSANTGYDSSTSWLSVPTLALLVVQDELLVHRVAGDQGRRREAGKSREYDRLVLVEDTIKSVLQEARTNGFDPKRVEAAIHQMELGQKHVRSILLAGFELGMGLLPGAWNDIYFYPPITRTQNINRLKSELSAGSFFESRIERYLLHNPHQLIFVMEPLASYNADFVASEQSRLASKVATLTDDDRQRIFEQGQQLLVTQEKTEDLGCLPTLALSDVAAKTKRILLDHSGVGDTPVQWRTTATNGITYFRAISTSIGLPAELKMSPHRAKETATRGLVVQCEVTHNRLSCDCFASPHKTITSLGTHTRDMAEIDDDIRLYTGGIRASTFLATNHSDLDQIEEGIALSGNCLDRNIDKMYELLSTLIRETNFDNVDRLKTLILGNASSLVNSVADSGHGYARTFAASTITPAMVRATSELYNGMTQVDFMNQLAATENFSDVVQKLKTIASHVLKHTSLRVAITCGEESVSMNEKALSTFLTALPKGSAKPPETIAFEPKYTKSFFPLPYAVNFSAKVLRGVPYTHPDGAKLQVYIGCPRLSVTVTQTQLLLRHALSP